MKNTDTVITNTTIISCSGNNPPQDHPKVYLKIEPISKMIVCPYCSRKFVVEI